MAIQVKRLTTALLTVLLSGVVASPTSSPTVAPTSAPTSEPNSGVSSDNDDSTDNSGGNSDNNDVPLVVNNTTNNTSNYTTTTTIVSTTKSTTTMDPSNAPVTTFAATLTVESALDFSTAAYLKSIATVSGVPSDNVEVKFVDFVVKVSYEFGATDATLTDVEVRESVASMLGVPVSSVTVSLTSSRRLAAGAGRRLVVTADVEISTTDATLSESIKVKAADATDFAAAIETATGKIAEPSVSKQPATEVVVVTEIRSLSATALPMPDTTAVATEMQKESGGKNFGVTVSADIPAFTTGNSTSTDDEDDYSDYGTSGAMKQMGMSGCFSVLVAFMVFFGH